MAERIPALLIAAVLCAALTGCGEDNEPTGPAPAESGTSGASTTSVAEAAQRDRFFAAMADRLRASGIGDPQAECITERLEVALTPKELAQIDRSEVPKRLERKSEAAGTACGTEALAPPGQ